MNADAAIPSPSRELLARDGAAASTVEVTAVTFEGILERLRDELEWKTIDLVKIDVEGAEHEFLPDLDPRRLCNINSWQMEYHPRGPKERLFDALERGGLHCVRDRIIRKDHGVAHFARRMTPAQI